MLDFVRDFLDKLGLDADEASFASSIVAIAVSVIVVAVPAIRRTVVRVFRHAYLATGIPDRKYARWFVAEYSTINNIYLDVQEDLDLAETYVPLAVYGAVDHDNATDLIATDVMSDRAAVKTIVIGDPGSGKSTLLKAFGVSIVRSRYRTTSPELSQIKPSRQLPFLVTLTALGREQEKISIVANLLRQIERSGACGDSQMFLLRLIRMQRCLVLLDGLDEVSQNRYEAVRDEIHRFGQETSPELPTGRCRVILTCRRQNFTNMQDEWIPSFANRSYMLTPFRDQEIARYLEKRQSHFVIAGKTPQSFRFELAASDSMDLHRTPLILAMSVGLYARTPFKVPSSIPVLFDAVITELLKRRNSKTFPVSHTLQFRYDDKRRFLDAFALRAASRASGFTDFHRQDLVKAARLMVEDLEAVDPLQVSAFVAEIESRAGLIVPMSGALGFAHRSIQEFLAASELAKNPRMGIEFLLSRADNDQWRQVAVLFASMCPQPLLDTFIESLTRQNLELAGHCLTVAKVRIEVAAPVVRWLVHTAQRESQQGGPQAQLRGRRESVAITLLSALLAITRSPMPEVSQLATEALQQMLLGNDEGGIGTSVFLSGDATAALQMVGGLAYSNNVSMAALAVEVAAGLPTDLRLVDPLWRCLSTPGLPALPAFGKTLGRLLALAMDRSCFDELQSQPPCPEPYVSDQKRLECYPFDSGVPRDSNLVTMLAWADRFGVEPTGERSAYFWAKANETKAFRRLDWANRHTVEVPVRIERHHLTVLSWLGGLAAAGVAMWLLVAHLSAFARPYGAGNLLLVLAPSVVSLALMIAVKIVANLRTETSDTMFDLGCFGFFLTSVPEVVLAAALLPLATWSVPFYIVVAGFLCCLFFRIPLAGIGRFERVFHIPALNPLLGLYGDPKCRHWLLRDPDARRMRIRKTPLRMEKFTFEDFESANSRHSQMR